MFGIGRLKSWIKRENAQESLGLDLRPADPHYRAYVGPPADYDLIAAMSFNLLTTLGLRQHHSVLDIGCGSLRIGRLLIPYLNSGNYTGIEPSSWLIDEGIRRETGEDQIRLKRPRFCIDDSARSLSPDVLFDFAVAQSIFSHCGLDLVERWLGEASSHLKDCGALAATFLIGEVDCADLGGSTRRQSTIPSGPWRGWRSRRALSSSSWTGSILGSNGRCTASRGSIRAGFGDGR